MEVLEATVIKGCPFCPNMDIKTANRGGKWVVGCVQCPVTLSAATEAEAVARWNNRTDLAPTSPDDPLFAELEGYKLHCERTEQHQVAELVQRAIEFMSKQNENCLTFSAILAHETSLHGATKRDLAMLKKAVTNVAKKDVLKRIQTQFKMMSEKATKAPDIITH